MKKSIQSKEDRLKFFVHRYTQTLDKIICCYETKKESENVSNYYQVCNQIDAEIGIYSNTLEYINKEITKLV